MIVLVGSEILFSRDANKKIKNFLELKMKHAYLCSPFYNGCSLKRLGFKFSKDFERRKKIKIKFLFFEFNFPLPLHSV